MADEPHYANKRKASDGSPPLYAARRPTGFSAAPPDPASASASLPADEIEIAKQRAQEIAARLFSSAEAKRPRVDINGDSDHGPVKGFGSSPPDLAQKYPVQYNNSQGGLSSSYGGYHGSSKMINIPNGRVGVIIGRGGETIKYLQNQSGAKIQVTRDSESDRTALTRAVELTGTPDQISRAEELIHEVLAEAEAGGGAGSGTGRSRLTPVQAGSDQLVMRVPNNKVGLVIGKGGESIKNMQASTGARIQVIPLHLPPGDTSNERTIQIDGTKEQVDAAKQLIDEVCSENRGRNPSMGSGYSQQGYRPFRPTSSWGPPGMPPMQQQQPGYGYMQSGAYPGPPPQYNTSQSAHGGYPPQAASGWDQSNPSNQQNAPSSGYDYYNQQTSQQQQTASGSSAQADTANYNYGQPAASAYNVHGSYGDTNYGNPSSGQHGYGQDGYGGYHVPSSQAGYGAPSSQPTYDQSQGYGSAPNYSTQDSSAPSHGAQGATASQPPSQQAPPPAQASSGTQSGGQAAPPSNGTPPYGSQGANQAGYGMPPSSQPGYGTHPSQAGYSHTGQVAYPGYGQYTAGQKLSNQPGYHQGPASYNASGYPPQPPAHSGYGQPDPATHNGSSGYTATVPPPSYGSNQPDPATTHHGSSGYSVTAPAPSYGSNQPDPATAHHGSSGYSATAPAPSYGSHQAYGTQPPSQAAYSGGQQQPPYADSYGSGGYPQHPAYSGDNASGGSAHGSYEGAQSAKSGVAKASPKA